MYMYEREMFELSRLIPQEHFPRDILEMDKARLKAKIEKDWADYEFSHPEEMTGRIQQARLQCMISLYGKISQIGG